MEHCIECGKPLIGSENETDFCDECAIEINGEDGYDDIDQSELIQNLNE